MKPADISVITVCRNDLEGLQRTVESVEMQSLAPGEHLVVDGASTDGTVDWLAGRTNRSYFRSVSEPDRGIYDAMNKGVAASTGRSVIFLNAGDELASSTVLAEVAEAHEKMGWRWAIGASDMSTQGRTVRLHSLSWARRWRFFAGFRSIPHQATVLERELLLRAGEFRLDLGLSADQELMLRCWQLSPPGRLNFIVARCDPHGISGQQAAGAWARQIAQYRELHGVVLGGVPILDAATTAFAVRWDQMKRIVSGVRQLAGRGSSPT